MIAAVWTQIGVRQTECRSLCRRSANATMRAMRTRKMRMRQMAVNSPPLGNLLPFFDEDCGGGGKSDAAECGIAIIIGILLLLLPSLLLVVLCCGSIVVDGMAIVGCGQGGPVELCAFEFTITMGIADFSGGSGAATAAVVCANAGAETPTAAVPSAPAEQFKAAIAFGCGWQTCSGDDEGIAAAEDEEASPTLALALAGVADAVNDERGLPVVDEVEDECGILSFCPLFPLLLANVVCQKRKKKKNVCVPKVGARIPLLLFAAAPPVLAYCLLAQMAMMMMMEMDGWKDGCLTGWLA